MRGLLVLMLCGLGLAACASSQEVEGRLNPNQRAFLAQGSQSDARAKFACFDPSIAMRLGGERASGLPSAWAVEQFQFGFCLAFDSETKFSRTDRIDYQGQTITRVQTASSSIPIYMPNWGSDLTASASDQRIRADYAVLFPVSQQLLTYADRHLHCLVEIVDLNKRVASLKESFRLKRKTEHVDDSQPVSTLIFSLSPLDIEGKQLNEEIREYNNRCLPYKTLEGSQDFIEFARDRSGIQMPFSRLLAALVE